MFGKSRTSAVADAAGRIAEDDKLRQSAMEAFRHARMARQQLAPPRNVVDIANRVATDHDLQDNLRRIVDELAEARDRLRGTHSHRWRNFLLLTVGGALVALFNPKTGQQARDWLRAKWSGNVTETFSSSNGGGLSIGQPGVVEQSVEVDVPVSTAYNQWTQFEEFPQFLDGVEEVRQLDDTRLHWVAKVAGKRQEWDAQIVEQEPDRVIAWRSIDGKPNGGRVQFTPLGDSRTRVAVRMEYAPEGLGEKAGSALGLDDRRVRGDLQRFKELIESRGQESGAWRGEVKSGQKSA